MRVGEREALPLASDVELALREGRLEVQAGRLITDRTDSPTTARCSWRVACVASLTLSGPVDLAVLDRHVMRSGFSLRGHARFAGGLRIEGSRLNLEGRL